MPVADVSSFKSVPVSWQVIKAVGVSATSSVLSGYDQGVIAAAMLTMKPDLNLSTIEEETSIGILNVAAALGGLMAGQVADRFGRRWTLAVANILFFLGSVLLAGCNDFGLLIFGRILMGFGVGIALVTAPMFTAELVPADKRGGLVAMCDVSTNLGILLGYSAGLIFFGVDQGWRAMFVLGAAPALLLLLCLPSVPESPRWLVAQGRVDDARAVLVSLSGAGSGANAAAVAAEAEGQLEQIAQAQAEDEDGKLVAWGEVLWPTDPVIRQMVFVGMGVAFFSQATGTEAAVYYTPQILKSAGIKSDWDVLVATMLVGLCKVLSLILATMLFDRKGRKPMLLISAAGLAFSFCVEGGSSLMGGQGAAPVLAVLGLCLYMSAFSLGFSPLTYVVCTEVFPSRIRAKALSVALFVTRVIAGLVSMSFKSLLQALTPPGVWFGFAFVSCCAFVFVLHYLPETKGLRLEEVHSIFMRYAAPAHENDKYLNANEDNGRDSGSSGSSQKQKAASLLKPSTISSERNPLV